MFIFAFYNIQRWVVFFQIQNISVLESKMTLQNQDKFFRFPIRECNIFCLEIFCRRPVCTDIFTRTTAQYIVLYVHCTISWYVWTVLEILFFSSGYCSLWNAYPRYIRYDFLHYFILRKTIMNLTAYCWEKLDVSTINFSFFIYAHVVVRFGSPSLPPVRAIQL